MASVMNLLIKYSKLAVVIFLLISAFFSITVWNITKDYYETLNQKKFENDTDISIDKIRVNLRRCGDVLATGVGFLKASDNVTIQDWHDFVEGLNIQQNYPGMLGYGLSMMLMPDEVAPMEQKMRSYGSHTFALKPAGIREKYSTIVYLEPMNERNVQAIGYDMYSNPIRKAAMDEARDSGKLTLSGKVTLVQEIDANKQAGILLYAPFYQKHIHIDTVEERKNGLIGFVYSPFRMDDLIKSIGANSVDINFKIYDGKDMTEERLLYDSSKKSTYVSKYTMTKRLTLYNRTWTIVFFSSSRFDASNNNRYTLLMTAGALAVYFILLSIIFALLKSRYILQKQADELNVIYKVLRKNTNDLLEAKEAAEASARSKSDFLAAMSHEIRTPMNGVLGMLGLLEQSRLDETQKHQVRVANSSATSLLGLINDILDFSKIEAGKMDFELLEFDLNDELHNFVESLEYKVHEKGLKITLDTTDVSYVNIITDPGRLRQILTNLVGNAIKFTEAGEICIKAALIREDSARGRLRIDVSDTGIGIPEDKITTLFEAFTQADGSTTRKYGGTGLGLSIVKRLCELMGGSISATSILGKGSTFSITLTVGLGSSKIIAKKTMPEIKNVHKENISWPTDTRILLVEDNATNQLVAQGMLKSIGLDCDIAGNGLEALESIRISNNTKPYTIILMDCQMPEMDGYDATRAVRAGKAGDENKKLPIIAMTANAMQGDRDKCTDAGMDDYIAKPINVSVLKSVLIKWILKGEGSELSNNTQDVAKPIEPNELLLWDEEDAFHRLGNSHALLNTIIESFIKDIPGFLHALQTAIEKNNSEDIQLYAHSLKGSSGNIGALKLQEISKQLEEAARKNNLEKVQAGLKECEQVINETLPLLQAHLAKGVKSEGRKKRLDSLQMSIDLQHLKKELENGMLVDTDALGIFVAYTDDTFSEKMKILKKHIERFEHDEAIKVINETMAGLE